MSEQIPEPTNHPEDNIKIQGPFTNNQVYNEQLQAPFTNNQELNGQLKEPLTNNKELNRQLKESLTNNQEFNGQSQGPFINDQVNIQRPKRKISLCIFATIILFIEICLNFYFVVSDCFMNGIIYGPDKKIDKHLVKVFGFGLPCGLLALILLVNSRTFDDPEKSFKIMIILLSIKLALFIGYFIFLFLDRDNKEIRLIVIIPELLYNAIILINEKLKKKNNQNGNN